MTSDSPSKVDLLAGYRELLQIAKERPEGILTPAETNQLIAYLERCIAEVETEMIVKKSKLTG